MLPRNPEAAAHKVESAAAPPLRDADHKALWKGNRLTIQQAEIIKIRTSGLRISPQWSSPLGRCHAVHRESMVEASSRRSREGMLPIPEWNKL